MKEVIEVAFSPSHIAFSTLLVMSIFYWLIVFVGVFNIDSFDLGKDIDIDKGISVETDTDTDIELNKGLSKDIPTGGHLSWFTEVLVFLNFGKVPFMVILSLCSLIAWTIAMLKTHYIGKLGLGTEIMLHVPIFIVSLLMTKYITNPLRGVFKDFKSEFESNKDLLGQVCTIVIPAKEQSMGQASIKTLSSPVLIMIKATKGNELKKGEQGLVVDYDPEKKIYYVEPFIGINP